MKLHTASKLDCDIDPLAAIRTNLNICVEGMEALRALQTLLIESLSHMNTDFVSGDFSDGLSHLFNHEFDSIDEALSALWDEFRTLTTKPEEV